MARRGTPTTREALAVLDSVVAALHPADLFLPRRQQNFYADGLVHAMTRFAIIYNRANDSSHERLSSPPAALLDLKYIRLSTDDGQAIQCLGSFVMSDLKAWSSLRAVSLAALSILR
jgi:hypothetical protein